MNPLIAAEEMFLQRSEDSSVSDLRRDDARNSIEVLHAIQRLSNQLASFSFSLAPNRQQKLNLADVEISTRADLFVQAPIRRQEHAGAAILRLTQDDAETPTARARRREMGLYVATLTRLHFDQNLSRDAPVSNRLCMSIDIQHGEYFQAPDSNTRRMNDLENACRFIAAMWQSV